MVVVAAVAVSVDATSSSHTAGGNSTTLGNGERMSRWYSTTWSTDDALNT